MPAPKYPPKGTVRRKLKAISKAKSIAKISAAREDELLNKLVKITEDAEAAENSEYSNKRNLEITERFLENFRERRQSIKGILRTRRLKKNKRLEYRKALGEIEIDIRFAKLARFSLKTEAFKLRGMEFNENVMQLRHKFPYSEQVNELKGILDDIKEIERLYTLLKRDKEIPVPQMEIVEATMGNLSVSKLGVEEAIRITRARARKVN